jgi:ankyrin repeat protein
VPNLEQQRKRAKELLRAHRDGDPEAARRIQLHLPRARALTTAAVIALPLQLADAQLVIAREAGFPTWPRLKRHVERSERTDEGEPLLHLAVRAGDLDAVRAAIPRSVRWQTREAMEMAIEADRRDIVQLLLEHAALVDRAGRRYGRWGGGMHAALLLRRGAAMIEVLLGGGASVAARDAEGRTPLAIAVRTGDAASAGLLRLAGASDREVDDVDRALGGAALHEPHRPFTNADHQHVSWAIRRNRIELVPRYLAMGLDPNVADDDGEYPLHLAVAARSPETVDALLDAGARVDARNYRDETPLTCALRGGDETIVARLVRAGARPADDADDLAEVFEEAADAVVHGRLGQLRALLDRHPRLATLRSAREHRATLLHYTGANGVEQERQRTPPNVVEIVELLLARGSDVNAPAFTYGGGPSQTTLYLAFTSSFPDEAGVMPELVRALVRGGARVDDANRGDLQTAQRSALPALVEAGVTIDLWLAATLGRLDDVRRFVAPDGTLRPGAKIGSEATADDRAILDTAIREAARMGHRDVVAYLFDAGAPFDQGDDEGMTPLHCAAWHGHLETTRFLVEHGARLEAKHVYDGTVLGMVMWGIRNQPESGAENAEVIEYLVAAGANLEAAGGRDAVMAAIATARAKRRR